MILPFKGSPWRPIYISVLLCGFLGLILSGLSLVGMIAFTVNLNSAANSLEVLAALSAFLGIGILYFVCAYWLNRLRKWAAIVALSLASIGLLVGLATFASSLEPLFPLGHNHVGDPELWFLLGALWLMEVMVIAILILMIRQLFCCFGAIRILLQTGRGFEVLPLET